MRSSVIKTPERYFKVQHNLSMEYFIETSVKTLYSTIFLLMVRDEVWFLLILPTMNESNYLTVDILTPLSILLIFIILTKLLF